MELNITARKRKQHLLRLILFAILLVAFINMLVKTPQMENLAFNGLFNYIIAIAGIAYILYQFALHFILVGREWLDNSASFVVSNNGINNQLNYFSSGSIPFQDIKETKMVRLKGKNYLLLVLKQPQDFISNRSVLKRRLLNRLVANTGTPIVLQEDEVNYDLRAIQRFIDDCLEDKLRTT